MAGLSTGGEAAILNALLTGRYLSAHTADPGNDGSNEVAGGSYARVAASTFTITPANPSVAANDDILEFPVATGSWGTVTHFGLWSAAVAGTFLGGKILNASKAITTDDILRFLAGTLTFTTDDV